MDLFEKLKPWELGILAKRREKRENLWHVSNLLQLSIVDGEVSCETELLERVAATWDVSPRNLDRLRRNGYSQLQDDLPIPTDRRKLIKQLYDLVGMVVCDGDASEAELDLIHGMAEKLGFSSADVDILIEKVIESMEAEKCNLSEEKGNA